MRQDIELFDALYPIMLSLTQLQELVNNTSMAVGSEAYAASLMIYNYAKASGKGAGLESMVDDLGRRFARKAKKVQPQTS